MFPLASRVLRSVGATALALSLLGVAHAGDLHIKIPKKSKPTPVQKLNQDGVKALEKHDYKRAKKLFYSAYLLDPDDPFTLNNLGYMAELDGEIDRAQRYYALAADQHSDAVVDRATIDAAKGKPVQMVAGNAADDQMKVNRLNVFAIGMLEKDRAPEADIALQKAMQIDPKNPFTLNNLGYAKEKEGELQEAYKYYTQAAASNSREPIIVSVHPSWRGKPIDQIARNNADKVQKEMNRTENTADQVARLNLRGVSAINRNERTTARQDFQQAYKLEPNNAFTLNNMGYLAEMDGDRETADFFYAKAQEAQASNAKVVQATRKAAEGKRVAEVASSSDSIVQQAQEQSIEARRRAGAGTMVALKNRNGETINPNAPVVADTESARTGRPARTASSETEVTTSTEKVAVPGTQSAPAVAAQPKKPVEIIRPIEDPGSLNSNADTPQPQ
jgi:Flp pilus assembly protein TadD